MDQQLNNTENKSERLPGIEDTQPVLNRGGSPFAQETSRKNKWVLLISVVVVLLLGAAGTFIFLSQKTAAPAQTVNKDIDSLKYAMVAGPLNTFYPTSGLNVDEITNNEQIFEGLVTYRDKKIVPNLASAWSNPDSSTWVFSLKPNVKFHTGRTMTASDVVASFDQVKATELGELYVDTITSVTAVGPDKVKIVTDGTDPLLLSKLVFFYIVDSKSTVKNNPVNGTGPYVVKANSEPTETSIELTAFNDYHGGHVGVRNLSAKVYEEGDEAIATALKKGEVNLASFADTSSSDAIKSKYTPLYVDDPTVFGIYFNQTVKSPLQNLKVRQAVSAAIDPARFIKDIGVTGTVATQLIVKDIPGYNSTIKRATVDVAHAKQLLTEAGYPDGVTITISYLDKIDLLQKFVDATTEQLKAAGITVKADPLEDGADLATHPAYFSGCSSDLVDLSDVYNSCVGETGYTNVAVAADLEKASATLDPVKRLTLLQNISKKVSEDVVMVPLYHGVAPYLIDTPSYVLPIDIPAASYLGVYFWRAHKQ